ncbi:hypothetical protein [Sinobaca sp. H24]|uniref:hypothetical protein n=1 Tax=Sinobaca sp. H24 TaxID=2923376 RepID=UPI00207974DE|nr:hypothetical protein [Sinobaca sp. H24]
MKNLQDLLQDTPVTEENTENKKMRMPSYKTLLLDDKRGKCRVAPLHHGGSYRHIRDPQTFEVELPEGLNADLALPEAGLSMDEGVDGLWIRRYFSG